MQRPKGPFGPGGGIPPEPPMLDNGLETGFEFESTSGVQGGTFVFRSNTSNGQYITGNGVPARTSGGSQTPYPVNFVVAGLPSTLSNISIRIHSIFPQNGDDVYFDVFALLLVGPAGQKVLLIADCGGGSFFSVEGTPGVTLNFSATATASAPDSTALSSRTYLPTKGAAASPGSAVPANFYAPAPAGPYSLNLADFNGTNPNGTWALYFIDDTNAVNHAWRYSYAELTIVIPTTSNVVDVRGNNHIQVFNAPTIVSGRIGNGIQFNGTSQYAQAGSSDLLRASSDGFAIALWFKPLSLPPDNRTILAKSPIFAGTPVGANHEYCLDINNNDPVWDLRWSFSYENLVGDSHSQVFATGITNNAWHFTVLSIDLNKLMALRFLNGTFVETGPFPSMNPQQGSSKFTLGADSTGANFFHGVVDEVYFWRRPLNRNEISYLYNSGNGRRYPWTQMGMLSPEPSTIQLRDERLMASPDEPLVGP